MDKESSPSQSLKKLEKYIYNLKAARQLNTLNTAPREAMIALRNDVSNARIQVDGYQKSEDTREQIELLGRALELLEQVREGILTASQYDLVDTVDVAQLSAMNEQIMERLR